MAYYVPLNTAAVRIGEGRKAEIEAVILEHESGSVLPVFTSGERFARFFGRASGESGRILPLATYPFGLAEMAARMEARDEICALAFNPEWTAPEVWRPAREPIPVWDFVRFTREIRPEIEKLSAETAANFGPAAPGTEAFARAIRADLPQIIEIADNAAARISEWDA